jgi:hypothetical protein
MADNKYAPADIKLLNQTMYDFARDGGGMDLDNPKRTELIKQLHQIGQLSISMKSERNQLLGQLLDNLAREMSTLNPSDVRRAQIVHKIIRLRDLLKQS